MKNIPFRTQARTVDHLGREQIADCPTAISELWKNSYDAYAKSVELHLYDDEDPVVAIFDNGHGMNYDEFVNKWLVVGTESKYFDKVTPEEDRNGLNPRPKQGQKGIGRLSSANLGPLLLIVSKRRDSDFVASLIDWRLFENPFLTLSDIKIPVIEFTSKEDLFTQLPELFEGLTGNIWGSSDDPERQRRIEEAWFNYDKLTLDEIEGFQFEEPVLPSQEIANTIIEARFELRFFENWQLWDGSADCGTAMLVSGINFDLRAQLDDMADDVTSVSARKNFKETLASFVDPYYDPANPEVNVVDPQFSYSVKVHSKDDTERLIIGPKQFNRSETNSLEHILDGYVDEKGVFRGRVKAFGEWVNPEIQYEIPPPNELKIHKRADWKVGSFDLYISTFENEERSTTLTNEEFKHYRELGAQFGGFLIFRNSLRVLPYGRVDNDFFEIEMRRSKHAGREFWQARRMFGRIALTRANNPNLKDKAGREGFLDNVAAKTLKLLVENILMRAARDYFGTAAESRLDKIKEIQEINKAEKAKIERNKLRKKQRSQFRSKLKTVSKVLPSYRESLSAWEEDIVIDTVDDIPDAQAELDRFRNEFVTFKLPGAPQNLGTLEEDYSRYRRDVAVCQEAIHRISIHIEDAIQRIDPPNPEEIIAKQRQRNAAQIHARIRKWRAEVSSLHVHEQDRITTLTEERNKLFHDQTSEIPRQVQEGDISLSQASQQMEHLRETLDIENEDIFESYIRAMESLTDSIDLELLAIGSTEENDELRAELDRLNNLAQLGITVEILGHELQSYDDMIGHGISQLPKELHNSKAVSEIRMGYAGLTNQLRFLSPLKLSGEKVQKWISGKEIYEYVLKFYGELLERRGIRFIASEKFSKFRVYDQPSRLYPVFINLINNSMFWVGVTEIPEKEIRLDVVDEAVFVSDNGPGIDELDIPKLFSLFFTKKLRGGRGVGLYLAKANLAAGGHKIRYLEKVSDELLSGANFVIDFKGAEYDG